MKDGSDASVATDSYRRYAEDDVDLIAGAGLDAYRFSISWSRVLPTGEGAINAPGLDHYSNMVDALLAKGITRRTPPCSTGTCRRPAGQGRLDQP
jgi:beta-glucosidase